ncbi:MAG: hypothetical protein QF535_15225, partial [Anaerolineales bacterium]|nr:hypothetical protein [Anaerolineales bacterium]
TLPTATDTLVGRATTDTLTNKTLTSPVITSISNSGTVTLPTGAETLVGRATTDTLTNKTLTTPTMSAPVLSAGGTTTAGSIKFKEGTDNGTNTVTLIGPAATADVTVTLPASTGSLATTAANNVWAGSQKATVTALTSTSNVMAIAILTSNDFSHTFTENTTLSNPSDTAVAGQSGSIYLTQHASSPKTLAFGSEYDFAGGTAPTVTATNSARDRLDYVVRADGKIEITSVLNLS